MIEPDPLPQEEETLQEKRERILEEARVREHRNMINFYQGEFPNENQETE